MKNFPMFLRMNDRRLIIVGGGEQAAQKCRLALKTEAQIIIAWDGELDGELTGVIKDGHAELHTEALTPAFFEGAALVFVATGDETRDREIYDMARAARALVNVVDQPDLCEASTPSIVDRDPVVVAIGTEGTAPVLARQLKTRVEQMLEPNLGGLAKLVGHLRDMAAQHLGPRARRDLWRWVFLAGPRAEFAAGRERAAANAIKAAITSGGAPTSDLAAASLVSAGRGGADMMTLRGINRLQEADVILHPDTLNSDILELARRDAERVALGPEADFATEILNHAQNGTRLVWLAECDPYSCETCKIIADTLAANNTPVERVAGAFTPA